MIDLTTLDQQELEQLRDNVSQELQRRRVLEQAPIRANEIAIEYSQAVGRQDGDEWAQPQGAHDSYPLGAIVTHEGKTWESLTPANVWEPGVSGWREQSTDPETGEPAPPEWVQPTGAHDAYKKGDRVTFDGAVWESVIDANVWSPKDYPQGWKKITEAQ